MSKLARLKPYNGKAHVLRTLTVFGIKFQEKNGWYKVEDDVADYLKSCVQRQEDPLSAKAFDVVDDEEEAAEIDELERQKATRAMAADARPARRVHGVEARQATPSPSNGGGGRGGDLTTTDLAQGTAPRGTGRPPAPGKTAKGKGFDDMSGNFDDDMAGRKRPIQIGRDGADDEGSDFDGKPNAPSMSPDLGNLNPPTHHDLDGHDDKNAVEPGDVAVTASKPSVAAKHDKDAEKRGHGRR